jgi:hypothetical protein
MRPYLYDAICKITHTHRLQSSLIHQNKVTMRPYLHDEICKITHTSILLVGRWSCCTWSLNKLRLCWWLRELIPGLQWDHKAFWTCTFGLQEHSTSGGRKHRKNNDHWIQDEGLFILKTMIIGHRMKLFILMPGGSGLPSPDTTARKGYVIRILLAAVFWRTDTANQRGGEWMGADKNSSRRRWELQQEKHDFHHTLQETI